MNINLEPIIVVGLTTREADDWAKRNIISLERKPIGTSELKNFRGTSRKLIILLPRCKIEAEDTVVLRVNTVLDLRQENI